jgi:hypothetical protein
MKNAKESCSFLKKRTKKLLLTGVHGPFRSRQCERVRQRPIVPGPVFE